METYDILVAVRHRGRAALSYAVWTFSGADAESVLVEAQRLAASKNQSNPEVNLFPITIGFSGSFDSMVTEVIPQ